MVLSCSWEQLLAAAYHIAGAVQDLEAVLHVAPHSGLCSDALKLWLARRCGSWQLLLVPAAHVQQPCCLQGGCLLCICVLRYGLCSVQLCCIACRHTALSVLLMACLHCTVQACAAKQSAGAQPCRAAGWVGSAGRGLLWVTATVAVPRPSGCGVAGCNCSCNSGFRGWGSSCYSCVCACATCSGKEGPL